MAYRSIGTKLGSSTAGITIPFPSGNAVNDIIVAAFYMESTAAVTAPDGSWTLKADLNTSAATHGRLQVWWKRVAGSADASNYVFSWTGSAFNAGWAAAFSGRITSGDPFDATPGTVENGSTSTVANVSTTSVTDLCDLVGAWTNFNGGGSWTPASGMTERLDDPVITANTQDAFTPAGSTGSISATNTQTDWMKGFIGALAPAPSHFPTIPTVAAGRIITATDATTGATRTFPDLSTLTKNAGDLLVAIVMGYQSSATANAVWSGWGGGFTELADLSTTTTMAIGIATKTSTGSETGTFTVTEAATITGFATMLVMSIPNWNSATPPEAGVYASGTSTAANSANLTASWGADDNLWIAISGTGRTATSGTFTGTTGAPANYSNLATTGIAGSAIGSCDLGVAFRQLNASSENVGAFTVDTSNARSAEAMLVVRGVAPAASGPNPAGPRPNREAYLRASNW